MPEEQNNTDQKKPEDKWYGFKFALLFSLQFGAILWLMIASRLVMGPEALSTLFFFLIMCAGTTMWMLQK